MGSTVLRIHPPSASEGRETAVAQFECKCGDGRCTASDISVAIVNGEFLVGGRQMIDSLFPNFDPQTWKASEIFINEIPRELTTTSFEVGSKQTVDESVLSTKALTGYQASELASASIDLSAATGVIAYCTPCEHIWIYEE